jgi:hypothetical protein
MTDTCASIDGVQRLVQSFGWRRIGIDGATGAGKSYLAEELSQALDLPVLDVNDYLHKNQGGYVDFIDYPALQAALSSMPALILCGACLRQVLANLGASLDGHIYIMRMQNGLWADEDECVFPDGVDVAIENLVSAAALISRRLDEPSDYFVVERDDDSVQRSIELMYYHAAFVPHETADVIYERDDHAA